MDEEEDKIECSTCYSLQAAIDHLERICFYIEMINPKTKKDFGLQQSYLKAQIRNIQKAQHWHEYYHATGKALSDNRTDVDYGNRGKRFRFGGGQRPPQQ